MTLVDLRGGMTVIGVVGGVTNDGDSGDVGEAGCGGTTGFGVLGTCGSVLTLHYMGGGGFHPPFSFRSLEPSRVI